MLKTFNIYFEQEFLDLIRHIQFIHLIEFSKY